MSKEFKPTGEFRYKIDYAEQGEQIEKLKEQGYKIYCPNIYNNGSIWKNEKTGKYVDIRYGDGVLIIEEVKEIEEKDLKNEAIEEIMYVNGCDEEEAENTFEDLMYLMEMY